MTSNDHDRQTTTTPSWSVLGAAAACLATATIASSSLPADAFPTAELRSERHGAPTLMVLAEAGESADGRADVTGLVSDLERGQSAESVLNTMVKINEAVDSDEDGLLENPFAREVSALEVGGRGGSGFGFVQLEQLYKKLSTAVAVVVVVVVAPDTPGVRQGRTTVVVSLNWKVCHQYTCQTDVKQKVSGIN